MHSHAFGCVWACSNAFESFAKILEILGDEQPTQDERAFNDLIWTYLDPDETDKSRNFFLTVVDSEQRRRMLEAAQKMEQGLDEGEALVDVDFLLESRTQKHKLYACMGLSEMTPQSPFPDLDKAATFEEYFATKYELFPPTETDRERPLIVGKVARSKFKPRHFCATSYRHKSQYREYVPHYAVKQFWMLRHTPRCFKSSPPAVPHQKHRATFFVEVTWRRVV